MTFTAQNPPLGPPGNGWSFTDGTQTEITSAESGWYLVTYKIDLRTNGIVAGADSMRAAAVLTLSDPGGPLTEVDGSMSAAQAPDSNHEYSISNTVLVAYDAGRELGLYWWAQYYDGTVVVADQTGLSLGPNATVAESPWIPATLPGTAIVPSEATASLVITRITAL